MYGFCFLFFALILVKKVTCASIWAEKKKNNQPIQTKKRLAIRKEKAKSMVEMKK